MKQYLKIGEDKFAEIEENGDVFLWSFSKGKLETRMNISTEELASAESLKDWKYKKELDNRIKYFNLYFQ